MVEPAKAEFARFLGRLTTGKMLILTVGIAPADTSCAKPWASVILQEDRIVVKIGSELGDKTDQYVAAVGVAAALSRAHPREVEEQKLAPRRVTYPMEASEFMDRVKTGQQHMLPPGDEHLRSSVAQSCEIRASRAEFKLYNYEEALEVGKWIQLAQTAALDSRPYVLEDGPELPKGPGHDADIGGEVREGMYAEGCTSLRGARMSGAI
jgi:hypothetical protein